MRHLRSEIVACVLVLLGPVTGLGAAEVSLFQPTGRGEGMRVLHFPPDQCVGSLWLQPESGSMWDAKRVRLNYGWERTAPAKGDVAVPRDRAVQLSVWLRPRPEEAARLLAQNPRRHYTLIASRNRVDPDDLSGLSTLGPDDLYWLMVCRIVPRTDADHCVLEPIRYLTGLRMLSLHSTGVTSKEMEHLRALRSLKALMFSGERSIGNVGLGVLKDLPALEYLDLDTGVTDAGLKEVAQLSNLRWLRIRTGGFWGPGLAELAQMPRLERLCLWGKTQITDRHIAHLEGLTQIKSLTLWAGCSNLTDAGLASIGKLRSLEELHFIGTPRLTPAGVAHLKNLKNLRKVDFGGAWGGPKNLQYGDDAMRQLAAVLPGLESIEGAGILSAEGVQALATFRNLKCLDLTLKDRHHGYHGPTGFSHLSELHSLEELRINSETALSDADLACIESLGHLKVLLIRSTEVTDRGLASISKLTQLEELSLAHTRVTRGGLNQLNDLPHLRVLDVLMRPDVRSRGGIDEMTLDLSGLQSLKELRMADVLLEDTDLAFLANLRHLEWVAIGAPSLPPSSLQYLSGLSELKRLSVWGLTRPMDQDLAHLARLANVRDLTLVGEISDSALSGLSGPAGLQSLTVRTSGPIRDQTIADLKQHMPTIEFIRIEEPMVPPTISPQPPSVSPPQRDRPASPPRRREPVRRRR